MAGTAKRSEKAGCVGRIVWCVLWRVREEVIWWAMGNRRWLAISARTAPPRLQTFSLSCHLPKNGASQTYRAVGCSILHCFQAKLETNRHRRITPHLESHAMMT